MTPLTRELRDHLQAAAEARRSGDVSAADAAELAALTCLRALLADTPARRPA
jgi:hypothetical protein